MIAITFIVKSPDKESPSRHVVTGDGRSLRNRVAD
jgi:hypothetical protein